MSNILAGQRVKALDFPPTVHASDTTAISNITQITYTAGSPEVGVTFIAPTTGRVLITTGGGVRNNAANADRLFIAPQVFLGSSSAGIEVLAPSVTLFGIGTSVGSANLSYQYLSRTEMLDNLTPGATYYVRAMYTVSPDTTNNNTCDLNTRAVLVAPTS